MAVNPEYCLIGIILNNPGLYEFIHKNIFLNSKCIEMYKLISGEQKKSNGFTKETLLELLKDNHKLNENDFYQMYDSAYYEDDFDKYYNHVLSNWAVINADKAIKELRSKKYTNVNDVKIELQNIINEISIDDNKEIRSSQTIIFEIISDLAKEYKPKLIQSYCQYIDNYGGYELGDFVIIAARPGVGKSSQMYNMILKDMKQNVRCGLFSLEAKEQKVYKIIGCIGANIDTKNMRTGLLTNIEKERLSNTYNSIYEMEVLTVDRVNVDIKSLCRKAKIMKDQKDIKKLYIDYLQLITCQEGKTRYEQMSNISRELKKLAMELDIVVISLAQLNRELEKRAEGKPKKSDLRDTGSIEQDADIIWLMYNFNKNINNQNEIILGNIIDKFREGAEGEFKSTFQKNTRRIKEWTN